jgi:hypothetical protein
MSQSHFSHARDTIRAAGGSRQECAAIMRRVWDEFTRAGALKAIAASDGLARPAAADTGQDCANEQSQDGLIGSSRTG